MNSNHDATRLSDIWGGPLPPYRAHEMNADYEDPALVAEHLQHAYRLPDRDKLEEILLDGHELTYADDPQRLRLTASFKAYGESVFEELYLCDVALQGLLSWNKKGYPGLLERIFLDAYGSGAVEPIMSALATLGQHMVLRPQKLDPLDPLALAIIANPLIRFFLDRHTNATRADVSRFLADALIDRWPAAPDRISAIVDRYLDHPQ